MLQEHCLHRDALDAVETQMRRCLGVGRIAGLALRHLESGGARVRAHLALETAFSLHLRPDAAILIAASVELLHNASLIHDDIQDNDRERRGQPALWVEGGLAQALCAGDLMISAAYSVLTELPYGPPISLAVAMLHGAIAETISGQAEDLSARSNTRFDETIAIATAKSAPLIALPVRLALLVAQAPGDALATAAAQALAVGYQISDDIADLPRDRAAGRLNSILALEQAGHSTAEALARALAVARERLTAADLAARSIPQDAGLPLTRLASLVRSNLTENAVAA